MILFSTDAVKNDGKPRARVPENAFNMFPFTFILEFTA